MEVTITNRQNVESVLPYKHEQHSEWNVGIKIDFLGSKCLIISIENEIKNVYNPIKGWDERKEFMNVKVCTEEEWFKMNYMIYGISVQEIEQELNNIGYKIVKEIR